MRRGGTEVAQEHMAVDAALFDRENETMARACLNVSATADSSYVVCSWDVRAGVGAASSGEDDGSVKVAIRSQGVQTNKTSV